MARQDLSDSKRQTSPSANVASNYAGGRRYGLELRGLLGLLLLACIVITACQGREAESSRAAQKASARASDAPGVPNPEMAPKLLQAQTGLEEASTAAPGIESQAIGQLQAIDALQAPAEDPAEDPAVGTAERAGSRRQSRMDQTEQGSLLVPVEITEMESERAKRSPEKKESNLAETRPSSRRRNEEQLRALAYVGTDGQKSDSDLLISRGQINSLVVGSKDERNTDERSTDELRRSQAEEARQLARAFLESHDRIESLQLFPSTGYWANTYLPGDPRLRRLHHRLSGLGSPANRLPHTLAQRPESPADPPTRAAMGVYLHADRRATEGPQRLRVRVGLEATQRRGGRRSAMRLAIVLHLDETPSPTKAAQLRSYLLALSQAREVGDRFSLRVAGRAVSDSSRFQIGEDDFRHGPLVDLCERLFDPSAQHLPGSQNMPGTFDGSRKMPGARETGPKKPGSQNMPDSQNMPGTFASSPVPLGIGEALELALGRLAAEDDPTRPMGSNGVVLVSAAPLDGTMDRVLPLVRAMARAGISFSAVDASGASPIELERLALESHGRSYTLDQKSVPEQMVEHELSAASRAVARALRLRVRLATGVKLVNILASQPLDTARTRHAKAVETALDRRLASSLGITADRGDDEAGLQILIPAFYAGDSHAIFLDLLVPGPGAVAEVTLRYKDLLHLENGVGRAHLELARGGGQRGPAEIRVLEGFLGHHIADQLRLASDELFRATDAAAEQRLRNLDLTLAGLMAELPPLAASAALATDRQMLGAYLRGLGNPKLEEPWAESLRLASLLEIQPSSLLGRFPRAGR